jgi:outer membrane protein OmpA-like peptidoglycan-associated protein
MTKTKQALLAGAVLPAFALMQPAPIAVAQSSPTILAQQQEPPPKPGQQQQQKPPPKQQQPARPPQPPAAQQPARPPQPPAAQQPAHPPQPPAAQQPAHPPQPPAAQQPHPPQPPAAQQPAHPPQPPAAQQPVHPPQPPAAQQPVHPPQPPAAQQPVHPPQPPAAQQPVHPPQPPAAQQPVSPPQPPAAQQPAHPPQPPAAQQPMHPPQPPAAQQPVHPPQPPAAQQPVPPPQPPAAQQRPGQPPPPAAQQPVPAQPPAAQARPVAPLGGAGLTVAPRTSQEVIEQHQRADEWRSGKVQDLRAQRQEVTEGGRTFIREPDRTIIRENGRVIIRHDEGDRFGFHARDVRVEQQGRDTVTIVERPDGIRIVTFTDPDGRMLRRLRRYPDGREVIIIENPVREYHGIGDYYVDLPPPVIRIPRERYILDTERASEADIYAVLTEPPVEPIERAYSLDEVRYSRPLLERMPSIDVDTINFDFGSWEVTLDQVDRLAFVAQAINKAVAANPREVFLIEGHTDAVGSDVDNLSLSDRRAQSAATVLSESFQVPAENLTTQGYGKQYLKIPTDGPERRNRRVTVRRITPLLMGQQ